MFRLVWAASVAVRGFLRMYMPSNIMLDVLRTRRGLKWGVPAVLLAVPLIGVAHACTSALVAGGPRWLNLVVVWAVWDALKFLGMGPLSMILLARARLRESAGRRQAVPAAPSADSVVTSESHVVK